VPVRRTKDVQEQTALRRPPKSARAELVPDLGPGTGVDRGAGFSFGWARLWDGRSRSRHLAKYRRNATASATCYDVLQ
jgi:hypothetical protein